MLRYLIGQASVSVENIGLHERVAEQAVTDQLTGLANNRHFREWMQRETQRLGRFGGELSLVLLDIDDFKSVNDTYGHLQGDRVLSSLGRILKLESRGVDEPARYGGEEFVLALPETPKAGAIEVAERVRERIQSTMVDGVEGNKADQRHRQHRRRDDARRRLRPAGADRRRRRRPLQGEARRQESGRGSEWAMNRKRARRAAGKAQGKALARRNDARALA